LLILDEPTANLDPNVRMEVLELVRQSQKDGATVLFSSHVLSEIEDVCDMATIMQRGKVITTFDVSEMRATHRVIGVPKQNWTEWWNRDSSKPILATNDVKIIEKTESRIVLDIVGPIQSHLRWLSEMPSEHLRIEPVGLRSVYESCCASS